MKRLPAISLLALWSCGPPQRHLLSPAPADAASVLFVIEGPTKSEIRAARVTRPFVDQLDADPSARISALYYPDALETLQFEAGAVPTADDSYLGPTRPLPAGATAFGLALEQDATWSALTADQLPDLRLPAFDYETCLAEGGCAPLDGSADRCLRPCPQPQTPEPVEPPMLPFRPDWTSSAGAEGQLDRHRPSEPPAIPCPVDQFQPVGSAVCTPIGTSSCALFPDLSRETRPTAYVDPAARPTPDGSPAFPNIAAALDTVPDGTIIGLARGDYALIAPIGISRGLELRGACLRDTRITMPGMSQAVGVHDGALSELRIEGDAPIRVGGRSTLSALRIQATGSAGIDQYGGELELRRVVIRGPVQTSLISGGALVAGDVQISGSASAWFCISTATVSRVRIGSGDLPRDGVLNGIVLHDTCRLWVDRLVVDHADRTALFLGNSAQAHVLDFVARDGGSVQPAAAVYCSVGSQIELRGAHISGSSGGGVFVDDCAISASDLVIEHAGELGRGAFETRQGFIDVQRMELNDNAISLRLDSLDDVVIDDLYVRDASRGAQIAPGEVVARAGGRGVKGARWRIDDGSTGLLVQGQQLSLVDLSINHMPSGGLDLVDAAGSTLDRVSIVAAGVFAVRTRLLIIGPELFNPIQLSNLSVQGLEGSTAQQLELSSSSLRVQRFALAGPGGTGVNADAAATVELMAGEIWGHQLGLALPYDPVRLPRALAGVRLHDNERTLELAP